MDDILWNGCAYMWERKEDLAGDLEDECLRVGDGFRCALFGDGRSAHIELVCRAAPVDDSSDEDVRCVSDGTFRVEVVDFHDLGSSISSSTGDLDHCVDFGWRGIAGPR